MPIDRRPRTPVNERVFDYVTRRTAFGQWLVATVDRQRTRVVPTSWSRLFGVVSLAALVVLFVTGLLLMFFFSPSNDLVTYTGPYVPLRGAQMSKALSSTLRISFEVRGGLLLRQTHHWAALLLPASLILQLLTTFFTGGFRKPRQWTWVALFALFVVALVGGWSGYGLPDDLLSGTGLRIAQGVALAIPFVGSRLSWLLFGGEYPGEIIAHLYPIHVALVPAALITLVAFRMVSAARHKPPQSADGGRTEDNVVGVPLLPTALTRDTGLFAFVAGVLLALAATVSIDPVWLYGPSSPGDASAGSQPDWYTGFLDGALRLVPPGWELVWLDHTWTLAILVPLLAVSAFLACAALYPFLERWATGDDRDHHLLDRPRNVPTRTALGVAGIVFYAALWAAGSADLIATAFRFSIEEVVGTLRVVLLVGTPLAFALTRSIAVALQERDRSMAEHGYETGRIVRLPGGEYVEIHASLDAQPRWRILGLPVYSPVELRPGEDGQISRLERIRVGLARVFFSGSAVRFDRGELRATPVTQTPAIESRSHDAQHAEAGTSV